MKKMLAALLFLLLAGSIHAQWVFQPFDDAVATGWFTDEYFDNGYGFAVMELSDTTEATEGTGSLKIDYTVAAGDGWGGYVVRRTPFPTTCVVYDLSAGTALRLRYKVITPTVKSHDGTMFMEVKMRDLDPGLSDADLWYAETKVDFSDASGTWVDVEIPLVLTNDKATGFAAQFTGGDAEWQIHETQGFEFALVYITAGDPVNPPTATGTILFDGWELIGNKYPPLITFDGMASQFGLDDMGWAGPDGKGEITLTDENTDYVEGTGALKMDYTCHASQDWGGFVAFDKEVTPPDSFNNRTALTIFLKNVTPFTSSVPQRGILRFFIFENKPILFLLPLFIYSIYFNIRISINLLGHFRFSFFTAPAY